jgi:hypothetical protein
MGNTVHGSSTDDRARPAQAPPHIPDTTRAHVISEANRRTVRAALEAWRSETGTITDLFAPDMVWRIQRRSAASREYATRQ